MVVAAMLEGGEGVGGRGLQEQRNPGGGEGEVRLVGVQRSLDFKQAARRRVHPIHRGDHRGDHRDPRHHAGPPTRGSVAAFIIPTTAIDVIIMIIIIIIVAQN